MGYDLPVGSKVKVIVAEDDEPTRFWLKLTLNQTKNFEVVAEAGDGRTCVEQVNQSKPDLVLMDIGMPIMDGVEAARLVKEALPNTKVIMFTSHDTDDSVFAALSAGADGYCLKTLTAEQLLKAIGSVMDGAAWLDPGIARRVLRAASQGMGGKEAGDEKPPDKVDSKEPVKDGPSPNPFALSQRGNGSIALTGRRLEQSRNRRQTVPGYRNHQNTHAPYHAQTFRVRQNTSGYQSNASGHCLTEKLGVQQATAE